MELIETTLKVAEEELDKKVREITWNDSPDIKKYLRAANIYSPSAWCMAFVVWCIKQACLKLQIENTFPVSGFCPYVADWGRKNNIMKTTPVRGDIFLLMDSHPTMPYYHTGFVEKVDSGNYYYTIEGNTDASGGAEGDGIYRKTRRNSSVVFLRWYEMIEYEEKFFKLYIEDKFISDCKLIDNKAYVPLRKLSEGLNLKLKVDNNKKEIILLK